MKQISEWALYSSEIVRIRKKSFFWKNRTKSFR